MSLARVDPGTDQRTPEVVSDTAFALAHRTDSVWAVTTPDLESV
jgi:hypothetical protein